MTSGFSSKLFLFFFLQIVKQQTWKTSKIGYRIFITENFLKMDKKTYLRGLKMI